MALRNRNAHMHFALAAVASAFQPKDTDQRQYDGNYVYRVLFQTSDTNSIGLYPGSESCGARTRPKWRGDDVPVLPCEARHACYDEPTARQAVLSPCPCRLRRGLLIKQAVDPLSLRTPRDDLRVTHLVFSR